MDERFVRWMLGGFGGLVIVMGVAIAWRYLPLEPTTVLPLGLVLMVAGIAACIVSMMDWTHAKTKTTKSTKT